MQVVSYQGFERCCQPSQAWNWRRGRGSIPETCCWMSRMIGGAMRLHAGCIQHAFWVSQEQSPASQACRDTVGLQGSHRMQTQVSARLPAIHFRQCHIATNLAQKDK